MGILDRLHMHGMVSEDNRRGQNYVNLGYSSTYRPDRMYFTKGNERSIHNICV